MLVFNNNYKQLFPLFKETVDKSQMVSFDCEMTGVNFESKTDGTKYDTHQFRYFKTKEVIKQFDIIQLGLTFFLKGLKEKEENYIERTFTFYLYKDSKLKNIKNNLFTNELTCHPASLKFLNENHFDFNCLISKGIHYNKLAYREKIKAILEKEEMVISSNALFLSEENERSLINVIYEITEFLISNNSKEKKKSFTMNSQLTLTYLLGCNLKQLNHMDHFSIVKNKGNDLSIIVEKRKAALSLTEFNKAFNSLNSFKSSLKINEIYKSRYSIPLYLKDNIDALVEDEVGFSIFIEYISQKKIPIIGHNIYFDMMFIYEKLIDDLPDDFYSFKTLVNKYFPVIYDTKSIAMTTGQYSNTKLENLYKAIHKMKLSSYVNFYPDAINGFCLYNELGDNMVHDAGYDSMITGRCFILMNKAIENNYEVIDLKEIVHQTGQKLIVAEKEIKIKKGWANLERFSDIVQYENFSIISVVDSPFAKVNWNVNKETKNDYEKQELLLMTQFKRVFWVKYNQKPFDHVITIYEIAKCFENEDYDISIVKTDYFSAFIEVLSDNKREEDDKAIKDLINGIYTKHQDIIDKIIPSKVFYSSFSKEINY